MSEATEGNKPVISRRNFLTGAGYAGVALVGLSRVDSLLPKESGFTFAKSRASSKTTKELLIATPASPPGFDMEYNVGAGYADQGLNLGAALTSWRNTPGPVPGSFSCAWRASNPAPNTVATLAESWTTGANGDTYTFQLRHGIMSAAGNELTADDVKWTFDRATALKAIGEFLNGVQNLSSVRVIDRYTVQFSLTAPTVDFLMTMNDIGRRYIIDSVEAKKHASAGDPWATAYFHSHSPTYGPYYLQGFVPGTSVTWAANPTFPNRAQIDTVRLEVVPESSSRLSALTTGAVQVAEGLTPTELASLRKSSGDVRLWSFANNAIAGVLMNFAFPPLNKKLVRQALSYAVPYEAVVADIFQGFATKSYGPATTLAGGFPLDIFPYKYDVAQAKSLLREAGLPNGFSTSYAYDSSDAEAEQIGVLLKTSFAKIGVDLTLDAMTTSGWNAALDGKKAPLIYWNVGADVPDLWYQLDNFYRTGAGTNFSNYANAKLDAFTERAGKATNPATRLQIAVAGLRELIADPAWLWLAEPTYVVATGKTVTGVNWYISDTRYNYVKFVG